MLHFGGTGKEEDENVEVIFFSISVCVECHLSQSGIRELEKVDKRDNRRVCSMCILQFDKFTILNV